MTHRANVKQAVALLVTAHQSGTQISTRAEMPLPGAEEAYAVQELVFAKIRPGERVRAWKVGSANVETEPAASPILRVHSSPADLPGSVFHRIGVEAEIAYRFARELPRRVTAYAFEEIAAAVGEALVAIEICDTRLADWNTAPELWKLADFQNNAALVVGSGSAAWQSIDFRAQRACLLLDGEKRVNVTGAHPFGDPFRLLPWLVAHCARRSGGLRAGDVVTTGSWGGVHYVKPGCTVRAQFDGIGEASVSIRHG